MNKPTFVENEIYHIFNRGVEKRIVFQTKKDYARFLHDLENFNTEERVINTSRELSEVKPRSAKGSKEPLVEIVAFCLMPNHFHLLLRQKAEHGISRFMQKVCGGYTMYFNKKNERVGSLFQGTFKAVLVDTGPHFLYIPHYVHKNPIDCAPRGTKDFKKFLETYLWSSYRDYAHETPTHSFVHPEIFIDTYRSKKAYKKDFESFLENKDGDAIPWFE